VAAVLLGVARAAIAQADEFIVFSSDRSVEWRIWRAEPDGSELEQLTDGTAEDNDVDPVVSPDGTTLLFTSTRGGTAGVWRMRLDGSEMERICDGDQAEWSPDGRQIAFRRENAILARDLATGEERALVGEGYPLCSGPAWSPDGGTIAFACRWDAGNGLFTVPADGGEPQKVYDKEGACEPHWSPDGATLVYETETHICTIRPDGADNRLVTWFGGVQRYGRFSPDGQSIIFCQGLSERGPWELYVIPAVGGAPLQLTEEGSDMYPHWVTTPPAPEGEG
jgi:TolB protein